MIRNFPWKLPTRIKPTDTIGIVCDVVSLGFMGRFQVLCFSVLFDFISFLIALSFAFQDEGLWLVWLSVLYGLAFDFVRLDLT